MTKRIVSLQDLGEKGRVTTAMKYPIYNKELKKELHSHKVGRALLVLHFLKGIRKEHTKRWNVGFISSLLNLLVYTHDLCVYNSGKSHSLNTIWYSDYDRCTWKMRRL